MPMHLCASPVLSCAALCSLQHLLLPVDTILAKDRPLQQQLDSM